jgi:NDP-sugar pyrophosphorylase family protein
MQAAILAGGLATRLGELTRNQAKSMVKVLGKSFLEYQIELLAKGGVRDIVLCIGHMGEQIESQILNGKKYGVTIKYSLENKPLGTAGALKNAESLLKDPFFTLYGDSYLFLDFRVVMRYFKAQKKLGLMTAYKNYDFYDRSNTAIEGNLVKKYSKKERTRDMVYIDYGANIFKKEVLTMIPENQFYSLEDLFMRLVEMEELMAFEVKERFYEIGSLQGLKEFEEYMTERQHDTFKSTNQDKSRWRSYGS